MLQQYPVVSTPGSGPGSSTPKAATFVVSPVPGDGDFTTIAAALAAIGPLGGGLILVREGTYPTATPKENSPAGGAEPILIVEDCIFSDLNPTLGVPGIQLIGTDGTLHDNVQIIGCTFTDMATPVQVTAFGYGAVTVGGFDNVFVQNCKIQRVAIARASSSMRGVVMKNVDTLVQDVLCYDIGSAGSNECFKHNNEAAFGTASGTSSWNNCVAYNAKRAFRQTMPVTMRVGHATVYNDTAGIAAAQVFMLQSSGTIQAESCVIEGAGDGTAFSATVTETNNDVFNVAAPGKVLDATDLTVDPILNDTANNDYRATDPAVAVGGLLGDPMGVFYPGGTVIFWAGVP